MFKWFQNLATPFPEQLISTPSKSFWTFAWGCTAGLRPYLLGMTIFTGLIAAFEAALFAMMGKIVDWLSGVPKELLWQNYTTQLIVLAAVLILSTIFILLQTMFKHQTLAATFPMRMRWNFHRLMLNQSMSFYQDEFAGRVAAKVMQTALAVRDVWFIVADIMVYVLVYFGSMVGIVAYFNSLIAIPFLLWLAAYVISLSYFVPRLSKTAQHQADARSLMTGRITDAYTNISTVKLFSHAGREASYAKDAMHEFIGTVHAQMRLVSMVEIINHVLNMLLIISTGMTALYLWSKGQVSVGGVAAATAMALRMNGISHWVMYEMTSLYEQIGTVQDGMNTLTTHNKIIDADDAKPLQVAHGEIQFDAVDFGYNLVALANQQQNHKKEVLKNLNLSIKPGEKVGLVGRSGAGKSTIVNLLLRFYEVEAGSILIDGQNVQAVTQNSLRASIGMVTQDTSLLHRSERGVKLSGGQRQRIAIARVMLKDAPILLLDEATSALDSEVETVIQASLYHLMQGKTVVAIAHRLSTIAAMDRLIVLDNGNIIEQGNHAELLKQGGLYASLWAHQSGGFLGEQ
jgi:ATP-binding cassette, subfamily B, multidrug efflux pump